MGHGVKAAVHLTAAITSFAIGNIFAGFVQSFKTLKEIWDATGGRDKVATEGWNLDKGKMDKFIGYFSKKQMFKIRMEETRIHIVRLKAWSVTFIHQQAGLLETNLEEVVPLFKKLFVKSFCEKGEELEEWVPCVERRMEQKFERADNELKEKVNSLEHKIDDLTIQVVAMLHRSRNSRRNSLTSSVDPQLKLTINKVNKGSGKHSIGSLASLTSASTISHESSNVGTE